MVNARLSLVLCSTAFAACETPGVTIVRPETQGADPTPAVVHVTLEDSAMAAALGWDEGVPGAAVIVQRFIDPFQPDTLFTDATGRVTIGGRVPGWYLIAGYRLLSADETGPTGGILRVFGDGVKASLPRGVVELNLRADEPGSLVISEIYYGGGTIDIQYGFDRFFELYNNSDTTILLDGIILGRAYSMVGANDPCEDHAAVREDSLGLWARAFHQFPGTGSDYSVDPGRTVTIALDAIDHSVVHPSLPDLSDADFEMEGTADVDNPDVPNMPDLSFSRTAHTHGMTMIPNAAYFLAQAITISDLPRQLISGTEYVRIPRGDVVDVLQTHWLDENSEPPSVRDEYCAWVHRDFDRLETPWYRPGNDNRISNHRRILRQESDGRILLQDVNASFVDWLLAPYSAGRVEY